LTQIRIVIASTISTTRRWLAVMVLVGAILLGSACPSSTGPTSEFAVRYHALIAGQVTTNAGAAVSAAQVFARYPSMSGGVTSRDATTDSGGFYSLLVEHFGFPANPDLNDSISAYVVAVQRLPGGGIGAKDSATVVVKFAPVEAARPTAHVQVRIRSLP
jgi:hypothetical protein